MTARIVEPFPATAFAASSIPSTSRRQLMRAWMKIRAFAYLGSVYYSGVLRGLWIPCWVKNIFLLRSHRECLLCPFTGTSVFVATGKAVDSRGVTCERQISESSIAHCILVKCTASILDKQSAFTVWVLSIISSIFSARNPGSHYPESVLNSDLTKLRFSNKIPLRRPCPLLLSSPGNSRRGIS